jgi:hypothetical protein
LSDVSAIAVRYLGHRRVSRGSEPKGDEKKMRLSAEWVKVLVAALTLLVLAVHALAG